MIRTMSASRIVLAAGVGLCLALASCNDDDKETRTVVSVARQEISQNTTELDEPIVVNDLTLSAGDTTETDLPSEI